MRHFLILINYKVPFESFVTIVPEHRKYLQSGVESGLVLVSGPRVPRTGGLIVARAKTPSEIQEFIESDPYRLANVADYEVIEFSPGRHQAFLDEWLE
jgi:uncharacterized protein YciI